MKKSKEKIKVLGTAIFLINALYYAAHFFISIMFADSSLDTIILLGLLLIMFILYCLEKKFVVKLKRDKIFYYFISIALLFYCSSLWAMNSKTAIWWGTEILQITFGLAFVSFCFDQDNDIEQFIKVIVLGGYIVVIYVIVFYGWNVITQMVGKTRISNDAINANTLGICIAYALIGNIYLLLKKELKWWYILALPAIVVLIVTESRKAILIVAIGSVLLLMVADKNKKNKVTNLLKNCIILIGCIFIFYWLSNSLAFSGVTERIIQLISGLFGGSNADSSTLIRFKMIQIGMQLFKEHPFLGIGIDNAKFIAGPIFGLETYYLHNNYVELLADVGMVGFIIYYSIYFVLIKGFVKYRDWSSLEYCFCLVMLIFLIVMDFGMVSFQSRETYFYMLVLYRESERIKKTHERKKIKGETN